jgi:hypothetical protein
MTGTNPNRRRLAAGALILSVILLLPGAVAGGDDAGTSSIRLTDGRVLTGAIREIEPSRYLVQTGDKLYEFTGAEIASVDGKPGIPESAAGGLVQYESYEELTGDGDVVLYAHFSTVNRTRKAWTTIQWGAAPHEMAQMATLEAYDGYGNRLTHHLEPRPGSDIQSVIVDLAVPVAPGEPVNLTTRYLLRKRIQEKDGTLSYTFGGDFPDDRIYTRKLKLPPGATLISTSPAPVQTFDAGGSRYLVWRRYYPKGEVFPITVRYRMPR